MTTGLIFAIAGVIVFSMGMAGLMLLARLIRRVLAFNLMGSGIYLILVGLGQRSGATDHVPQAMVLTGIVVSVAATALALALTRKLHSITGETVLPENEDE
jgi:multicomponent Na+:H+ antiporter subunit C